MCVCVCIKYTNMKKINTRSSKNDFIYSLKYLPTLNVLVFKYENIEPSSKSMIVRSAGAVEYTDCTSAQG